MKKLLTGLVIMGAVSLFAGCSANSNSPITIDYSEYPNDFMIRLHADQEYILKNGDDSINFSAYTHAPFKKNQILTYGNLTSDLSHTVYYRKTEPVLIHRNDKDYIWICEEKNGVFTGASFYYLTKYNSFGNDNGMVNLAIRDSVLDPNDFVMAKSINCFGSAQSEAHYFINELGKPEEIFDDEEFYCIRSPYSDEVLCLDNDINTWVYADENAKNSSVQKVPAGTTFRRLRVPKKAEYQYVDGILEDGRVMRVVEEYWFSEPTAYQAMMDKDANQFDYHVVR